MNIEEYDDWDWVVCPRCMGVTTVECECGGDLCACENSGERDCPTCHGEGDVSPEREDQYFEAMRQARRATPRQGGL